jgi:hypothetical protein
MVDAFASLYQWIRDDGASVLLARLTGARVAAGEPGLQETTLHLHVDESLWGPRGAAERTVMIEESADEWARTRAPDPRWGQTPRREGTALLLVTPDLGEEVRTCVFVDETKGADDPKVVLLRELLEREVGQQEPSERRARYLRWLAGPELEARFAARALVSDADLPDVDPRGEVARAFARRLFAEQQGSGRASVAELMPRLFGRTDEAGRTAILNALASCVADPDGGVARRCLDYLFELPEEGVEALVPAKAEEAARALERLADELDDERRPRADRLAAKLR